MGALVLALAGLATHVPAAGPGDPDQPDKVTAVRGASTVVPIEVVGNVILVRATVNGAVRAILILDTGASTSLVTPMLMARLGQPVSPRARRQAVSVAGGQQLEVPFVTLGVVQVGDARVEGLEVGVYEVFFPEAAEIEGILGADFLRHFRVMLDKDARQLTLAPLSR